jgi:hypothetical protein
LAHELSIEIAVAPNAALVPKNDLRFIATSPIRFIRFSYFRIAPEELFAVSATVYKTDGPAMLPLQQGEKEKCKSFHSFQIIFLKTVVFCLRRGSISLDPRLDIV